ncbi:MAG: DNA-directed RNA polymerase subunit alpha [Patescibacteria group bacterium]|jgi:DNA-directed RNA polymerase subunit alpha
MENLLLPSKIEWHKGDGKNQKTVVIEPCYYGYGTTLGNTLRRVLLSSLPGAAIASFKIKGVDHEFSAVEGVKEDIVEIILNLKRLIFKLHGDEPVKMTLKVKGEKVVTSGDFDANAQVEVVDSDLVIATLTDKKSELEMEVTVVPGRGFISSDNQDKAHLMVGEIAIDSTFSPVVAVGYKVENTRVGQITNYDKLNLYIETNGIITPEEAFDQAVDIMIGQFQALKGDQNMAVKGKSEESKEE